MIIHYQTTVRLALNSQTSKEEQNEANHFHCLSQVSQLPSMVIGWLPVLSIGYLFLHTPLPASRLKEIRKTRWIPQCQISCQVHTYLATWDYCYCCSFLAERSTNKSFGLGVDLLGFLFKVGAKWVIQVPMSWIYYLRHNKRQAATKKLPRDGSRVTVSKIWLKTPQVTKRHQFKWRRLKQI